jgi:hypothetical protein
MSFQMYGSRQLTQASEPVGMPTDTMPWLGGTGVQKAADGCRAGLVSSTLGARARRRRRILMLGCGVSKLDGFKVPNKRMSHAAAPHWPEIRAHKRMRFPSRRFTTVMCCPMELGSAVKREG